VLWKGSGGPKTWEEEIIVESDVKDIDQAAWIVTATRMGFGFSYMPVERFS
jgi:hypothetical protein